MDEYLKQLNNFKAFDITNCSYAQFRELKNKQSSMLYECINRCNNDGSDVKKHRHAYVDMSVADLLVVIQKNNEIIEKIETYINKKLSDKRK